MTDGYYSFNSKVQPLPSLTDDPTPIIQLADPVLFAAANFFRQILNTNLQPRFSDEARACGLTHANLDNFVDNLVVAQVIDYPLDPSALRITNYKFPLMSVYTEEEYFHQWTLTNQMVRRTIVVSWILPPLSVQQMNRMYEFLGNASKAMLAYGPQGYDPKVNPQGPSVWKTSNLSFGAMIGVKHLPYMGLDKEKKTAYFPSIQMRMAIMERAQAPVPQNYESFSGISLLREDLVDGYNPANPITDFIDGYIYPNITITSCLPNSGTIQGNSLLVIQGTGFLAEKIAEVKVCGAAVKSINVLSPTVIMVVTNPGISVGTGDVVAYDQQGNAYTLTNGFTYTSP